MGKKSHWTQILDDMNKTTSLTNLQISNILRSIVIFLKAQQGKVKENITQPENPQNNKTKLIKKNPQIKGQNKGKGKGQPEANDNIQKQSLEEINDEEACYSKRWINQNCHHKSQFFFSQNKIEMKKKATGFLLGKQELNNGQSFSVQLNNDFGIFIGVASQEYVNKTESLIDLKKNQQQNINLIYYYGAGNIINCSLKYQQSSRGYPKMYKGDYVNVTLDKQKGQLHYKIQNGNQTSTQIVNQPKLKDPKIKWVPFISLCKDTSVIINPENKEAIIENN